VWCIKGVLNLPIRHWLRSANFAIEGILHAAKTQRHLRYHFFSAAVVLLLSYIFGVSRMEFLIIALSVIAVLLAEMFNTAIEALVDIMSPAQCEKARIAKDIAAGAVLITVFGVAVIGYIILFPYLRDFFHRGLYVTKHSTEEIALIAFILVVILVVITKTYFGRGPLSAEYAERPCARLFGMGGDNVYYGKFYRLSAFFCHCGDNRPEQGYHKSSYSLGGHPRQPYGCICYLSAVPAVFVRVRNSPLTRSTTRLWNLGGCHKERFRLDRL
jgi:diacylglycerol kinase